MKTTFALLLFAPWIIVNAARQTLGALAEFWQEALGGGDRDELT